VSKRGERKHWTVLLAEDDDQAALLVEIALGKVSSIPVEVHRARNGFEALVMVEDLLPDLILLDLQMPGPSGQEILETIKGADELRSIPVAVLTGSDPDKVMAETYGLGSNHFISKPDDPAVLEKRLWELMKNLDELASVRRGHGVIQATATSAITASSETTRVFLTWFGLGLVAVVLIVFAYIRGIL